MHESNSFGNNMILITSWWGKEKSFKLIPVRQDCPYVEVIYDPASSLLIVIGKEIKSNFHMMAKVDDNGDPVKAKVKRSNGSAYKEERKTIETFTEHYISEKDEQSEFIKLFAVNAQRFDFQKYMTEVKQNESAPQPEPVS